MEAKLKLIHRPKLFALYLQCNVYAIKKRPKRCLWLISSRSQYFGCREGTLAVSNFSCTVLVPHEQTASAASPSPAAAPSPEAMETLDDFRGHPQFNDLKRLVQGDPAMLSNVLQMIGQQSPNLLARIHENQNEFIALMNEPVDETVPPAAAGAPAGGMGSMMG